MTDHCYSVSVHDIVDYILMKGDIDNRYVKKGRMLEGTKIHQLVQKNYTAEDLAEVAVKTKITVEHFTLNIQGRIDGVLSYGNEPVIEEIKSTYTDLEFLDRPHENHLAQGMMYAYIYASINQLPFIQVRITYYNAADKKTKSFDTNYTLETLANFFEDICQKYFIYLSMKEKLIIARDDSIAQLQFPFEYRKYQKEITARIYNSIKEEKNIFINAPTGTGKTINAVFPSLKILPSLNNGKIFYLSAKSTQKQIAEDTVKLLRENGLCLKSITITAKEKCCFLEKPSCNPDDCPYAKGYYDKLPQALGEILNQENIITFEIICSYAEKHRMCPFELSLDIANWADMIICDYNYVFDPSAALKRFFDENAQGGDYIFLIDEAHNLIDRSRDMYSADLDKKMILSAKAAAKGNKRLNNSLKDINSELLTYKKNCEENEVLIMEDISDKLLGNLYKFQNAADDFLSKSASNRTEAYQMIYDLYFEVNAFMGIYDIKNNAHCIFYDKSEKQLKLFCTDAQAYLRRILEKGKSAVFFSATLTPMHYYCELLGGNKEDHLLNVPAIFDKENFTIIVDKSVNTRYTHREQYYQPIADRIYQIIQNRKGNYLVFFPSYAFLESVYQCYETSYGCKLILKQQRFMNEKEREEFLLKFETSASVCAFTVAGGVFSEGIDLVGDRLTGTIICGVSLPMVCTQRELIRSHFDDIGKNGFEYAYLFPGMNKVLQSMGRVIRTKEDVGCAVLLDERFAHHAYKKCFPPQYDQMVFVSSIEELTEELLRIRN